MITGDNTLTACYVARHCAFAVFSFSNYRQSALLSRFCPKILSYVLLPHFKPKKISSSFPGGHDNRRQRSHRLSLPRVCPKILAYALLPRFQPKKISSFLLLVAMITGDNVLTAFHVCAAIALLHLF
jgi:magnesium-transporting ATPase (P-type)